MEILSKKYPGIYFICDQCGALIGHVKQTEVYNKNDVYCPICKWKNTLEYDKNYEGIMTEEKEDVQSQSL